ncbi:hypothetical protein [Lacrimispora brassicae]
MKFKRCCLSLLLSICLVLSVPFSSFANLATDSQAVYAAENEAIQSRAFSITPFSSISTIQNTVDYSGVLVSFIYYDMYGVIKYSYFPVGSDGSFKFSLPSDVDMPWRLGVVLSKTALPSSGNYSVIADFGMHTALTYGTSAISVRRDNNNASSEYGGTESSSLIQSMGDFQISSVVDLGFVSALELTATIIGSVPSSLGGVVKINFSKSTAPPAFASPGADTVGQDVQNAISDNTGKMAEEQEKTNGFLIEIIQTISSQLKSFWDQLAGEFTNLYNKMNQQHQEAMEAVEDQTSRLEDSVQDQTQKVQDKLEDVKTGIISGIINGLKSLFIPSDEFFKTYFDDLFSWFSDRLGFLSFPIDLLVQLVEMFLGSSSTDFVVTLPSFEIMGEPLLREASFNLTQFLNENFGFLLTAIHLVVSVIMVFGFVKLCERKWEEVMMN